MTEKVLYDVLAANRAAVDSIRAAYQRCAKNGPRVMRQCVIAAILVFAVGGYYEHKQVQAATAKLEAEKVIASMKEVAAETAMIGGTAIPVASSCSSTKQEI